MMSSSGVMLDPFVDGRGGAGGERRQARGFAPDQQASFPPDVALAYAAVLKAPPAVVRAALDRLGLGLRRHNTTNGDPRRLNNVTARDYGFAAGMDYPSRPTRGGLLARRRRHQLGLAQGLGGGRSDAFLAGVYGTTVRPGLSGRRARLRQSLDDDQPHRARRPAHRELQCAELRRPARSRLSLRGRLPTAGVTPYAALRRRASTRRPTARPISPAAASGSATRR